MAGYMTVMGNCASCKRFIAFNPIHVPSIRIGESREPICLSCFDRWNEIHRVSKGLDPLNLHPRAYEGEPEENL